MEATFFPYLIAFAWTGFFMLIGVALRAKIKLFQKMLLPAALIGGVLGFIVMNIPGVHIIGAPSFNGWVSIEPITFSIMTFHLFAFGFVGIGLLRNEANTKEAKKAFWRGSWWIACMFFFMYAVQGLIGYGVFSIWDTIYEGSINPIVGYLFGTGFTQGPGQAVSYASIYQSSGVYGVVDAINIGLTFAAIGFFVCALIGVPFAYYGIKKGWVENKEIQDLSDEFVRGTMDPDSVNSCADSVTHPGNMDSFGYHLAITFFLYGVAFLIGYVWWLVVPTVFKPIGMGMMFFWGMFAAMGFRKFLSAIKADHMLDNATSRRITGLCVDFMIASVFMSIEVAAIKAYIVPMVIIVLLGVFVTFCCILWFGRRLPELGFERTLVTFGTCTGTVATGLLLLRIVDPDFKTTVATEAGMYNVVAFFVGIPLTFGIPLAYEMGGLALLAFIGTAIAMPICIFVPKMVGKRKF